MRGMESRTWGFRRSALIVIVFAIAMGYMESAVVVDLRAALGLPAVPTFPLTEAQGAQERMVWIELGRELATLVMLVGIGLLVDRRGWAWLAWTAVAFGVWDITYYAWLAVFVGWPTSLFDMDLLFLLPLPWIGPVWAPLAVSLALIGFGLAVGRRSIVGRPPIVRPRHIVGGVVGGATVLASFMADASGVLAGQVPEPFLWPLFALGLGIASVAAWDALRPVDQAVTVRVPAVSPPSGVE
jgi:hypothetical protein